MYWSYLGSGMLMGYNGITSIGTILATAIPFQWSHRCQRWPKPKIVGFVSIGLHLTRTIGRLFTIILGSTFGAVWLPMKKQIWEIWAVGPSLWSLFVVIVCYTNCWLNHPPEKWWSSSDWIIIPTYPNLVGENKKNHVPPTITYQYYNRL